MISLLSSAFLAAAMPMCWFDGFRSSALEVWLRLRRRAGSHRVIVFCLGVFAPACADDYDDYDLDVVAYVRAMLSLYFAVLERSLISWFASWGLSLTFAFWATNIEAQVDGENIWGGQCRSAS